VSCALLLVVLLAIGPLFQPLPNVRTSISVYDFCVCCCSFLILLGLTVCCLCERLTIQLVKRLPLVVPGLSRIYLQTENGGDGYP